MKLKLPGFHFIAYALAKYVLFFLGVFLLEIARFPVCYGKSPDSIPVKCIKCIISAKPFYKLWQDKFSPP